MGVIKFCFALASFTLFLVLAPGLANTSFAANPCNPCAKNPCAKNPCAKNPCAKNPCAKNPCAKNPCSNQSKPIRSKHITDYKKLVAQGKALWNNESLGKSGMSCMTCHEGYELLNMDKHGGRWPHAVKMTSDIVTLDQMVNFCMINPMESGPLDPNGIEMTAIAAYYREYVKAYKPSANPCAKNPCAKNPCGKNPCAKNPCGR